MSFATKNLLALSICASQINIFRHKWISQPNVPSVPARAPKLVFGALVAGGGISFSCQPRSLKLRRCLLIQSG